MSKFCNRDSQPGIHIPLGVGYICLSEGVHSLYVCNNLTLRHKNGVYLYSSEIQNYIKNSGRGTCSEEGWEPLFYKLGLLGNFGRMYGLLSCEICFFRVLRHNADDWSCAQTLPLCASAIVVTESDISKKFMLSFLQDSCSSNESVVQQERRNFIVSSICLSVRLTDVTLHLRSPLHCRASITTLCLITIGSTTLSNVHRSSMLLAINMTVPWRHMSYAHSP